MTTDYRYTKAGKRRFGCKNVYRLTWLIQSILRRVGIAWHNRFSDECTNDFACCTNIGQAWLRIPPRRGLSVKRNAAKPDA